MKETWLNRVLLALGCALVADIPIAILGLYVHPPYQLATILWLILSAIFYAAFVLIRRQRN